MLSQCWRGHQPVSCSVHKSHSGTKTWKVPGEPLALSPWGKPGKTGRHMSSSNRVNYFSRKKGKPKKQRQMIWLLPWSFNISELLQGGFSTLRVGLSTPIKEIRTLFSTDAPYSVILVSGKFMLKETITNS